MALEAAFVAMETGRVAVETCFVAMENGRAVMDTGLLIDVDLSDFSDGGRSTLGLTLHEGRDLSGSLGHEGRNLCWSPSEVRDLLRSSIEARDLFRSSGHEGRSDLFWSPTDIRELFMSSGVLALFEGRDLWGSSEKCRLSPGDWQEVTSVSSNSSYR